jgi:cyclase
VVLYLKEEKVLFMSDLLFVGCHPYLADGDLDGLLNALQSLSGLRAEHFVPGHGPVGTEEDLHLMIEYIQYCRETAGELCREEDGLEARIKEQKPGGKFAGWRFGQFFQSNLRFLCQGLTAKKSE